MTEKQAMDLLNKIVFSEYVDLDMLPDDIEDFCSANDITIDYYIMEFV
jgi:hypothetical protein